VDGDKISYNYEKYKEINKALSKSGIFVNTRYSGETEEQYQNRCKIMMEYGDLDVRERINPDSITAIGLWALSHNKPVILSDIPDYLLRKHIARNESLLDMRQLLKEAWMDVILDPDIIVQKPYFGAIHRFPDLMFHYNDRYTSSLLKTVINRNPNLGTIAVLWGYGQTKSLPTYLQYSKTSLYDNLAITDSKTHTYFGKIDNVHNMVEKQVILDHLYLHKDENPLQFLEKQEELVDIEDGKYSNVTFEPLFKTLRYLVNHELKESTNSFEVDYEYFKHVYLMLFNNEVNQQRLDAYSEARKKIQNEIKRRVRDNPDLIRKIKVAH